MASPAPGKPVPSRPAQVEPGHAPDRPLALPAFLLTPRPRMVLFWENLKAIFTPKPKGKRSAGPVFQKVWVEARFPAKSMVCSVLWHIWLVTFPFFIAPYIPYHPKPRPRYQAPRIQITWYAPAPHLPELSPGPTSASPKKEVTLGATAYHPRQTIISRPLKINHPRQTLIQPKFPEPPRDMNVHLPNIVMWPVTPQPVPRPKLALSGGLKLRKWHPQVALPEAPNPDASGEQQPAPFNLASAPVTSPQPNLSLKAGRVVARKAQEAGPRPEVPAPEALGLGPASGALSEAAVDRLIALSVNPAPPSPGIQVRQGSLGAEFAVGPMGIKPGWPSGNSGPDVSTAGGGPVGTGSGTGTGNGVGYAGGAGSGGPQVPGVSISGGNGPTSVIASLPAYPEPVRPAPPRADIPKPTPLGGPPVMERAKIGELERKVFGPKKIYTLTVNMPNLTSVSGSWILGFSELNEPLAREEFPKASGGSPAQPAKSLRSYLSTSIAELAARLAPTPSPSAERTNAAVTDQATSLPEPAGAGNGDGTKASGASSSQPRGEHKLTAPFPARKVDPKYPPELIREHIEGEVVLYAIIRKDGTVDSVRVLRSLDPRLDDYAMRAFARWTFDPARVNGEAVDLEALVHIPFRYHPLF